MEHGIHGARYMEPGIHGARHMQPGIHEASHDEHLCHALHVTRNDGMWEVPDALASSPVAPASQFTRSQGKRPPLRLLPRLNWTFLVHGDFSPIQIDNDSTGV